MTAATTYDAVAIRDQVRELGLVAEVDHSPIWGSPFKHVYVLLTGARWDGRLVQISPQEELGGGPGLLAGERPSVTAEGDEPEVLEDADELMAWLADKHGGAS